MPLQEGIYYQPGVRPGSSFGVIFLRADPTASGAAVSQSIEALWRVYQGLKSGSLRDLPGHPVPSGNLTVLLGFGIKAFAIPKASKAAPEGLSNYGLFRSPLASGGGPLLIGSGLTYADDIKANPATEEIIVQFIADTQLAVRRAIVETWKCLFDAAADPPVLSVSAYFSGFQRDDGRSWLDFHDGISNLKSSDRYSAIAIKPTGDPSTAWTADGSYMAYIRIHVDLPLWRRLSPEMQAITVGRAKLSGCPLTSADANGSAQTLVGRPTSPGGEIGHDDAFRETPINPDVKVVASHVQRVNHHRGPIEDPNSLRVFRQGFEFLESWDRTPGFRAGLNFVSFQDTPERLYRVLTQPGWLGDTNFGGTQPLNLLAVR
jgi:Dyp-type peroxidase family